MFITYSKYCLKCEKTKVFKLHGIKLCCLCNDKSAYNWMEYVRPFTNNWCFWFVLVVFIQAPYTFDLLHLIQFPMWLVETSSNVLSPYIDKEKLLFISTVLVIVLILWFFNFFMNVQIFEHNIKKPQIIQIL